MIHGKKIVVVMPAYNAQNTLRQTYSELPHDIVDAVVLVDDASIDSTQKVAGELGIKTLVHKKNLGYGANQKTCYKVALRLGADVVVMLHPDYQYSPRLVSALAAMITSEHYDVALGSRILGNSALKGGMPLYKYVANRLLTFVQNIALGTKLSEYHTGFRAFNRKVLETLPLEENSDDFVFDNQMLAQVCFFGFNIGEISCPTRYFKDASSIGFSRAVRYGLGVLVTSIQFIASKLRVGNARIFSRSGRRLSLDYSTSNTLIDSSRQG